MYTKWFIGILVEGSWWAVSQFALKDRATDQCSVNSILATSNEPCLRTFYTTYFQDS